MKIIIFLLLILYSIVFNYLRHFPNRGNWIFKYEDENWGKILIITIRIICFSCGLCGLIYTIFFEK